jgi:hypothetical protein
MTAATASTTTSDPIYPPAVVKSDGSVQSVAETTDMSQEDLSMDIAPPPPAENPFTKLFSHCFPSKARLEEEDHEKENLLEIEREAPHDGKCNLVSVSLWTAFRRCR